MSAPVSDRTSSFFFSIIVSRAAEDQPATCAIQSVRL
jgi:hypothetical protein